MDDGRLTSRNKLTAAVASENLEFYVVDRSITTEHEDGSSFQVSKEELLKILGIDLLLNQKKLNPNSYNDIPALLADQANQTPGEIQHVIDATADVNVDAGAAYYEYIGPASGSLQNYTRLTAAEAQTFFSSQKEVKINGYWVDTTENDLADRNTIKVGNAMRGRGVFFNGERIHGEAKQDNPTEDAHIKIFNRWP